MKTTDTNVRNGESPVYFERCKNVQNRVIIQQINRSQEKSCISNIAMNDNIDRRNKSVKSGFYNIIVKLIGGVTVRVGPMPVNP